MNFQRLNIGGGMTVKVDADLYPKLREFSWRWLKEPYSAVGFINGRCKVTYMANTVLGLGQDVPVFHLNGDKLDCRRVNCSLTNAGIRPRRKRKGATSPHKGVTRLPKGGYQAAIWFKGRNIYLGRFSVEYEAAKAYQDASLRLRGSNDC